MFTDLFVQNSARLTSHIADALDDPHAAEDLAQDVWLQALQRDAPPAWPDLQRTADNLIRAELRRRADQPDLIGIRLPGGRRTVPGPTTTTATITPVERTPQPQPLAA